MSSQHEISEYIDNLPLHKTLCKGFRPDDVYDVICTISSMYNKLLSKAYEENDVLKKEIEFLKEERRVQVLQESEKVEVVTAAQEEGMDSLMNNESEIFAKEEKVNSFIKEDAYDILMKMERSVSEYKEETNAVEKNNGEAMTDKELQKLKRGELLEILLEQSRENESLKIQLADKNKAIDVLNEKLECRKIDLKDAGTIAEASFKLNGVFEAAEKAAQQYLENLQALYEKEKEDYSKKEVEFEKRCSALMQATKERCDFMKEDTLKRCEDMEASVKKQCEELLKVTEMKCREREKASEERCQMLD